MSHLGGHFGGHLGDRVAALVDGELDFPARERALDHLSRCPQCREAVDLERWAKTEVQSTGGAEPSAALLMSLSRVSGREPPYATPQVPQLPLRATRGRARPAGLLAAGAGSVSVALLGLAYVVGGASAVSQQRPVDPPVQRFSTEFARVGDPMPFSDPATDVFPVLSNSTGAGNR